MNAVFVDCTPELKAVIRGRQLSVPNNVAINYGDPSHDDLARLAGEADIVLVEHTKISEDVLTRCSNLKGIVFMGTGAESYVPVEWAKARGIPVLTTPGYGNTAVAEHAMALTFAAARKIAAMDAEIRMGTWLPRGGLQLKGSKVAVVGLGEIGRTYAGMASALGMEVAGWNRTPVDTPYFVADLDEAIQDASFISLHLALGEQTKNIINARRLAMLQKGAVLINTARAGLVDESALQDALASGHLSHAGLDVMWSEPLPADSRWRDSRNATLTAHAAYMTDDAYAELWLRTVAALDKITLQVASSS